MMSAYSAVSHGHAHPRILAALDAQARRLAVPSRAFYSDRLGPFLEKLCAVAGLDAALPMNTGAEAVETAIKAARRWGYRVKGIAPDRAEIIVAEGNFHGRTTTIVGFSSEPDYRDGFGPFAPGFRSVPFGDLAAMERAITPEHRRRPGRADPGRGRHHRAAGGLSRRPAPLCDRHHVLLILDEVQSGLGRTGAWFAFQHENVRARRADPRQGAGRRRAAGLGLRRHARAHGRVHAGLARLDLRRQCARRRGRARGAARDRGGRPGRAQPRARRAHAGAAASAMRSPALKEVRGRGLWVGAEIDPPTPSAREVCERLLAKGVLSKETHDTVVRLAPPLVIARDDLDWALDRFEDVSARASHASAPLARRRREKKRGTP